jgi:hypothetical protein
VIRPRSLAPIVLAVVVQATVGCARWPGDDVARENAVIAARIDHRLGMRGGANERMAFSRGGPKGERVACVDVVRERTRPARFIYRSGCLFTESDLPRAVFDRWRRDFCENS